MEPNNNLELLHARQLKLQKRVFVYIEHSVSDPLDRIEVPIFKKKEITTESMPDIIKFVAYTFGLILKDYEYCAGVRYTNKEDALEIEYLTINYLLKHIPEHYVCNYSPKMISDYVKVVVKQMDAPLTK